MYPNRDSDNRPDVKSTPAGEKFLRQLRREVAEVHEREQKRLADEAAYRARSAWRK
ncbi:MAG: hypothetical protein ABSH22_21995 [Tepidisphaeraceae bacterium]|jgi:hypothetical protein